MATNKIPWPAVSRFEARVSGGLVYFREKGAMYWNHLDAADSAKVRKVYRFDGK